MRELLIDFDVKSAQKAAAKLSARDLQAALALVADMPKSADRDALRGQLYRAWAALNPNAAWKAALADPLDKSKGDLLGAVAGEVAKTNPVRRNRPGAESRHGRAAIGGGQRSFQRVE